MVGEDHVPLDVCDPLTRVVVPINVFHITVAVGVDVLEILKSIEPAIGFSRTPLTNWGEDHAPPEKKAPTIKGLPVASISYQTAAASAPEEATAMRGPMAKCPEVESCTAVDQVPAVLMDDWTC